MTIAYVTRNTPRRCNTGRLWPAEDAARDAIHTVEQLGADPILTNAVTLLIEAQKMTAAYIDLALAGPPNDNPGTPAA